MPRISAAAGKEQAEQKRQPEQKNEKQAERVPVITKSKRRKLERIKAPVVLLRKMRGAEGK